MPSIKKPKAIASIEAIEAAAPAPISTPDNGEVPIATVGSNSGNVTTAFVKGRNIAKSFADAAAELNVPPEQAAIQKERVRELKIGLIFAYLADRVPEYKDFTDLAAYERGKKVLETVGKQRTKMEADAENSARVDVTRLFAKYGITNHNAQGGSNAMTEEQKAAKKAEKKAAELKALTEQLIADGWVKTDGTQLAAFVTPNMNSADDFTDQVLLFSRGLKATLAKAENVISANDQKVIRPKMKEAVEALEAIVSIVKKATEAAAITAQAEGK